MPVAVYLVAAVTAVGLLYVIVAAVAHAKLRGARGVRCPETRAAAAIEMDAKHAALILSNGGEDLRLKRTFRSAGAQAGLDEPGAHGH